MKFNKLILSNIGRKTLGWVSIIFMTISFGFNGYNFLFNDSVLSLIAFICFIIVWLYFF